MKHVPIRVRMAAAFALAMAIVLAATAWFLYTRLDSQLSTTLNRNLRLRAEDLIALVKQPDASLQDSSTGRFVERGESYAQLLDTSGRVLESTRPIGSMPLIDPSELERALRQHETFVDRSSTPGLDEPSRLLATTVVRDGRRLVLVVGTTRQDQAETLGSLRDLLLITGPVALALATLAGYVLAGLSLRPVESMRRRAAEISAETPGDRLPVPQTGDEVERLAETLNEMLARLEAALERERDFVADAGHELRTPLALLRTELELALRHADSREELLAAVRASSVEADRLARLADDLLLIARSDRGKLPLRLERLEAADLLDTTASRFEWRAQEEGRTIRVRSGEGLVLPGDRLRLEQALGNLVDNALRHGEGEVTLSARAVNGNVELEVTDEGKGLPQQFLQRAFERFSRPDESRTGGGSGLGLAIVRVIAEAHGGSARVENDDGHGAIALIVLPATLG
jgi:heavy metal sensor kinase